MSTTPVLIPRAALVLSDTATIEQGRLLSIAILVVAVFSALGALWIIATFTFIRQLRFFRHQLILGLAISDLFMALNFIVSTSSNVAGNPIGDPSRTLFCSINGFVTQIFVVQTDYWVLIIAANTFLILGDQKNAAAWVQENWPVLWLLPWGFSMLWSTLGLVIAGYGDIGAWCWFTSDTTRLLVNFIQRWVIIVSILAIYIRLYFIIYKAHRGTVSGAADDEVSVVLNVMPLGSSKRATSTIKLRGDAKALKRVSYRMMQYPLVYMFIWIIPTAIRIYHATGGGQAPLYINILDKGCIVVQGLVDAIVYGFNERAWNGWKEHLFGGTRRLPI